MFGVADVTGTLDYGQCFIQYEVESNGNKSTFKVLEGRQIKITLLFLLYMKFLV